MPAHGSRRFHEAGVGSRTGLRLSAVARDEDGFEDLDAFYRASQAAMDHHAGAASEDLDDASDSYDDAVAEQTAYSIASSKPGKSRPANSSSMDIQNSSMLSPRAALRKPGQATSSSPRARNAIAGPSSSRLPVSPRRRSNGRANITIGDDLDDYDLHDASEGSRSFDLLAMAGDDAAAMEGEEDENDMTSRAPPTPLAPSKGLAARKSQKASSSSKGKAPAQSTRPDYLYDSDVDDDYNVPAYIADDYDDAPEIYEAPSRPKAAATKAKAKSATPKSPNRAPNNAQRSYAQPASPSQQHRKAPSKSKSREVEQYYDYGDDTIPVAPRPKQSKAPASKASKTASSKSKRPGEKVQVVRSQVQSSIIDKDGLRRSTRQKFEPLEYWRGERIRYGRPSLPKGITPADLRGRSASVNTDGVEEVMFRRRVPVLDIKEVIRVPRAPGEGTFADTKRPKSGTQRNRAKKEERETQSPDVMGDDYYPHLDPKADTIQPEDGWDEQTVSSGLVIDGDTGEEIEKVIVRTKASLQPTMMHPYEFKFEKVFTFGGQMGVGVLHLGPGKRKDTKANKDDFVFTVMQGALRVQVHRKIFTVGPGAIFHVPAGNNYSLKNICERDVHLFVASARVARKSESNDLTMFSQASDASFGTPGMTRTILDRRRSAISPAPARYLAQNVPQTQDESDYDDEEEEEPELELETAPPPVSKSVARNNAASQPIEDEDDFEVSRTLKTKRKFRKIV